MGQQQCMQGNSVDVYSDGACIDRDNADTSAPDGSSSDDSDKEVGADEISPPYQVKYYRRPGTAPACREQGPEGAKSIRSAARGHYARRRHANERTARMCHVKH